MPEGPYEKIREYELNIRVLKEEDFRSKEDKNIKDEI